MGGNADEVGQRLEGIQAEVMMDRDWPELPSDFKADALRALARIVGARAGSLLSLTLSLNSRNLE